MTGGCGRQLESLRLRHVKPFHLFEELSQPQSSCVLFLGRNTSRWVLRFFLALVFLKRLLWGLLLSSSSFMWFYFSQTRLPDFLELMSRMPIYKFPCFPSSDVSEIISQDPQGFFSVIMWLSNMYSYSGHFQFQSLKNWLWVLLFTPRGKGHGKHCPSELECSSPS